MAASIPGGGQSPEGGYKRANLGELQGSATKQPRTEESDTLSIPQLIASLNESLSADLANEDKIARLAETIQLHSRIIDFSNPSYGSQLVEIAQRCLSLAPANTIFKALNTNVVDVQFPNEILEMILENISVQLKDYICSRPTYLGLLSGAGSVSKAWRRVILSYFGRSLGDVGVPSNTRSQVTNLSNLEKFIRLAEICGESIRSINLVNISSDPALWRSVDLSRLLKQLPNLECISTRNLTDLDSLESMPHTTNITKLDLSYARETGAPSDPQEEDSQEGDSQEEGSSGSSSGVNFDANINIYPQRIMTIATCFKSLQYLSLRGTGLDEEMLETLLKNAVFNIRNLDICINGKLTGRALTQHSDKLQQLEVLHLDVYHSEFEHLANTDLPSLRTLTMSIREMNQMNLFAQSRWRFTLLNLHLLTTSSLTHETIIALLNALSCLRLLDLLGRKEIKNRGFLEASQQKPSLEELYVSRVYPELLAGLLISPICSNLHTLWMDDNIPLSEIDIQAFETTSITLKTLLGELSFSNPELMRRWCHTKAVRHLSKLTLKRLDASQAEVLREAPFLQTLEVLKIFSSSGIKQAFLHLARYGELSNLVRLDVQMETDIIDSTAVSIAESPSFPSLTQLDYGHWSSDYTSKERREIEGRIIAALEMKKNRKK